MNRRYFLERSSIAAIAVAGLPQAIRNRQNYPGKYKTELKYGVAEQWYYEIGLYHSTVENFAAAKDEEKVLGLKINFYNNDLTNPAQTGEYKYIIRSSEAEDKSSNLWKITTKLDSKIAGNHEFPKDYPKNLSFRCMPKSFVNILGKKDSTVASVPYPPPSSSSAGDDEDCFLTTACVRHKQLPDDCDELQTLRHLRDDSCLVCRKVAYWSNNTKLQAPPLYRLSTGAVTKRKYIITCINI